MPFQLNLLQKDFGAYAMMDHLTLFGVNSPEKLPVVLYSGNPPYLVIPIQPSQLLQWLIVFEFRSG